MDKAIVVRYLIDNGWISLGKYWSKEKIPQYKLLISEDLHWLYCGDNTYNIYDVRNMIGIIAMFGCS